VGYAFCLETRFQDNLTLLDSHFRIGGALGTGLQVGDCPKISGKVKDKCIAGSMLLHLTKTSSAYLENVWAWYEILS
jgi:hypothetical protein